MLDLKMNENDFIEVRQEDITIDQSPESERRLCAEIIETLTNGGKHITFAESCTGGMLAEMLTAVSGASECFDGSFVTYANEQRKADRCRARNAGKIRRGIVSNRS